MRERRLSSLGRLVPYKGYKYLIDSAKYLDDSYIILIGGGGPLKSQLMAQIEENGLQDKVSCWDLSRTRMFRHTSEPATCSA